MKKIFFLCIFLLTIVSGNAQATWSQKASLDSLACAGATSGSIGNYIYVCCHTELWLFDPTANIWIKKSDFPGADRTNAISFTNGADIYVGLGEGPQFGLGPYRDFYVYHLLTDQWDTNALLFPGVSLAGASTFHIGTKDYVVGGFDSSGVADTTLWIVDLTLGWVWHRGAAFPGTARYIATAHAVAGVGYFGTGFGTNGSPLNDCWSYAPATDTWIQVSNFSGLPRGNAISFDVEGKWVVGLGSDCPIYGDFYVFSPTTGTWTPFDSIPSVPRTDATGASLGGKHYVITGKLSITPCVYTPETWELSGSPTSAPSGHEVASISVTAYPNPYVDYFTIDVSGQECDIVIIDASGREVSRVHVAERAEAVTFVQASEGFYIIEIIGEKFHYIAKMIRQ